MKHLPTARFRKPIKATFILFLVVLLVTGSFVALDKIFACMYQLPYLTHCGDYCCQSGCPANTAGICQPLNQ